MRIFFLSKMDARLFNVVQLGFAFLLIFFAFNGAGFIEEIVLNTVSHEQANSTHGGKVINEKAGYYSLSIIYLSFTFASFVAAPLVSFVGAKWSMVVGAGCYLIFMLSFLHILEWSLYVTSAILGFGAAIIWTGQGNYLTLNSDTETISRNSGIIWAMLQGCLVFSGLFLYFELQGKTSIDSETRTVIYTCFSALIGLGMLCLALLRKPPPQPPKSPPKGDSDELVESVSAGNPDVIDSVSTVPIIAEAETSGKMKLFLKDFLKTFQLLKTKQMILLAIVFSYTGLELTFWSGVYPTCLGFTQTFTTTHSSNSIVALNAIFIGVGQILGGGSFGLFGHRTNVYGRNPIILLGAVVHFICFFLVFLNIPFEAPLGTTSGLTYIKSSVYLALFCSFLVGLGDSCWNTQCYSILGSLYSEESAPAFAVFKFFQSLFAAISFYYGSLLQLQWQLLILSVTCFIATLSFLPVEFYAMSKAAAPKTA